MSQPAGRLFREVAGPGAGPGAAGPDGIAPGRAGPSWAGPGGPGPDRALRRTVLVLFVSLLVMSAVAAFAVGGLIAASGDSAAVDGDSIALPFAAEVGALAAAPATAPGDDIPGLGPTPPVVVSLTPRADATAAGGGTPGSPTDLTTDGPEPTGTAPAATPGTNAAPTGSPAANGPSQIERIPITPRSAPGAG